MIIFIFFHPFVYSFYGVPVNRKQFRPEVIARLLQQNMHPVYAIHESNNGEQFGFGVGTGTFRRVQELRYGSNQVLRWHLAHEFNNSMKPFLF